MKASTPRIRIPRISAETIAWLPEILFIFITTLAGLLARGRWVNPIGDPGTWWSTAYRVAEGEVLYRDFYLQFGPLSPYLLGLGARIFGASSAYMLFALWIPAVAAGVFLVRASRPLLALSERLALVGILLAVSVFAPGEGRLVFPYSAPASHALLFSAAALLAATRSRTTPVRAYSAGSLAGLAFCSKQEIGLACLVAILAPILAPTVSGEKRWKEWGIRVSVAFGTAALLGAVIVFSSASLDSLRSESRVWPIAPVPPASWSYLYRAVAGVSAPGWAMQVGESTWWLLWHVTLFLALGLLLARERRKSFWLPLAAVFFSLLVWGWVEEFDWSSRNFYPMSLSMAIAFLVALAGIADRRLPHRTAVVVFGLFAGLTGVRTAFAPSWTSPYSGVAHFGAAMTWVVAICVLVPRYFSREGPAWTWVHRSLVAAMLVAAWLGAASGVRSLFEDRSVETATRQGPVFTRRVHADLLRRLTENLGESERIWVLPEINGIDALLRARSVSPYSWHTPGWLDDSGERTLLQRVGRAPPDVVVIFERDTTEYGVAPFGNGYGRRLMEWIEENYVVVEKTRAGRILRRRPEVRDGNTKTER